MFGDEHIDAFLMNPQKTLGVSACSGEAFTASDTKMMDAKAGTEDKKHTKRCRWEKEREIQRRKSNGRHHFGRETKIRKWVHISGNRFSSEK